MSDRRPTHTPKKAHGIALLEEWAKAPPWNERPAIHAESEMVLAALYGKAH